MSRLAQPFALHSRSLIRGTSSVLVLSGLAAIAWWGHTYHWDFQHAVASMFSAHKSDVPSQGESPMPATKPAKDQPLSITGELPPITFSSAQAARNCGINTEKIHVRSLDNQLTANAQVKYDDSRHAQLSSRFSGTVFQVVRRLGSPAEKGDVLALIDSAEVGEAKLKLLQACVLHQLREQHLERLVKLQDTVARKEQIEAEASYRLAKIGRFEAMQRLANMGFALELKEVERLGEDDLREKLQFLGIPLEQRPQSQSFNLIPLLAPFAGTIVRCDLVQGESVQALASVYELTDTSRMWVHLNVRQDDAVKLRVGMPIQFEPSAGATTVDGKINTISSELDERTHTIHALAEVRNPPVAPESNERVLRAGMFGRVAITLEKQSGLAVPASAMHWIWEIGKEVIFITDDHGKSFHPVVVEKGITRGGYVQVIVDLEAGCEVVSDGSRILATELSEYLRERFGDNAAAVRNFEHSNNIHDDSTKTQSLQ